MSRRDNLYRKRERNTKAEGERLTYFILHNIISSLLFIWLGFRFDIFGVREFTFPGDLFDSEFIIDFLILYVTILGLSVLSIVIGRIVGYLILMLAFKKAINDIVTINKEGINRISMTLVVSVLISAFVFQIGLLIIIHRGIFGELDSLKNIIGLFIVYIWLKIGIYFIAKWITKSKT